MVDYTSSTSLSREVEEHAIDYDKLPFPLIDSPFFESAVEGRQLTSVEKELIRRYRDDGYLIISNRTIEKQLTDAVCVDVEGKMDRATGRLQDAWRSFDSSRAIAVHENILSILRLLYGREPIPFQTLNFIKGTEQATHSDAIHFNSLPRGFMCAVWVALEDITIKQGPLHYFHASHKLPEYDYYDLGIADELLWPDEPVDTEPGFRSPLAQKKYRLYEQVIAKLAEENRFERRLLTLKRGDFLVWAANLLHGGNPILEPGSSRKSQVIHYHFDGVIPWMPHFSNPKLGLYHVPPLVNVRTLESMRFSYNFMPVRFLPVGIKNTYRIELNPRGTSVEGHSDIPYYQEIACLKGELEGYKKEIAALQAQLTDMTNSRLWKVAQSAMELKKKLLG